MLKWMLDKLWIWTTKNTTKNSSTVMELKNNFQRPWDYGDFELSPMSHITTKYCKTTPAENIKTNFESITDQKEKEEFIKNLKVEYEAIVEHYELNPQD